LLQLQISDQIATGLAHTSEVVLVARLLSFTHEGT